MQPKPNDLAPAISQTRRASAHFERKFGRAVHAPPAMSAVVDLSSLSGVMKGPDLGPT